MNACLQQQKVRIIKHNKFNVTTGILLLRIMPFLSSPVYVNDSA